MTSLDLLVIDIDDTFIYHRTVALANKLFLETVYSFFNKKLPDGLYTTRKTMRLTIKTLLLNFYKFNPSSKKIKRLARLKLTAFYLYLLYFLRKLNNRFFKIKSSEKIIKIWADTVVKLGIKEEEYKLSKEVIKKNLNKGILQIYNKVKPKRVIAISQNFVVKEDPIKKILGIDVVESNQFLVSNGYITGYRLNVKNKEDKLRIARKYKGKRIGIFIEDYDDILLLRLKNLRFVLYKRKLERFIDKKNLTTISFK